MHFLSCSCPYKFVMNSTVTGSSLSGHLESWKRCIIQFFFSGQQSESQHADLLRFFKSCWSNVS
uniref:Uncharacterized protein n=1 Tax=Anguilla anguilla TaxID=7936 RepID=A0A0E9X0N4_ANGAN